MKHEYFIINCVENGWIVTRNCSLFEAAISGSTQPLWVFNHQRTMARFISGKGFRIRKVTPTKSVAEPK